MPAHTSAPKINFSWKKLHSLKTSDKGFGKGFYHIIHNGTVKNIEFVCDNEMCWERCILLVPLQTIAKTALNYHKSSF